MSKQQHTPGPWEWISNNTLWGGERGTEEILNAADDRKPYGMHSALIEHHWEFETAAANRRLIAAAPELLTALKLIRGHMDTDEYSYEVADAAIKRAEGEA